MKVQCNERLPVRHSSKSILQKSGLITSRMISNEFIHRARKVVGFSTISVQIGTITLLLKIKHIGWDTEHVWLKAHRSHAIPLGSIFDLCLSLYRLTSAPSTRETRWSSSRGVTSSSSSTSTQPTATATTESLRGRRGSILHFCWALRAVMQMLGSLLYRAQTET